MEIGRYLYVRKREQEKKEILDSGGSGGGLEGDLKEL